MRSPVRCAHHDRSSHSSKTSGVVQLRWKLRFLIAAAGVLGSVAADGGCEDGGGAEDKAKELDGCGGL
jgi:hypothetical protein